MINASELRIGNWIDRTAGEMQIIGITNEYASFADSDHVYYKYLEPIPLTPEILLSCGFRNVGDGYYGGSKYNFGFFSFDYIDSLNLCECIEGNYVNVCSIKNLHQLQNLYFALTGEELNYQP